MRRLLSAVVLFHLCCSHPDPSAAAEFSVTINSNTPITFLSSPFSTPGGDPLALSDLIIPPTDLRSMSVFLWNEAYLQYDTATYWTNSGGWINGSGTNRVRRGEGFFVRLGNTDTNADHIFTFTGTLLSNSVTTITGLAANINFMGFPYLASVAISNLNLDTGIHPYIWGHTMLTWDEDTQAYRGFFYDAVGELGGGWQDGDDPGAPSPYVLKPMEGFIIYTILSSTGFVWEVNAP